MKKYPPRTIGEVLHYVPHYPVIREEAESIKLRIVCDCSAKENCDLTSLNDCLETGPSLKPLLIDILLRNRMRCYCITGDIKKGFLQIQISKKDRDALRIFWYEILIPDSLKNIALPGQYLVLDLAKVVETALRTWKHSNQK